MSKTSLSKEQLKKIRDMYLSHTGIREMSIEMALSEKDIMDNINAMGLRRIVGKKQLENEEKYKRMIFDYWADLGHDVDVYSNQYGDVRSDLFNGLPKYLKTTKYLSIK